MYTYYRVWQGPTFTSPGGYLRRGPGWIVERWDPASREWIAIPSAGLSRSLESGDPTIDEISQAQFERETAAPGQRS